MQRAHFEHLAEQAFGSLPEELLGVVNNVVFVVEEWPDTETLQCLRIGGRDGLLGLYQGHPLAERSTQVSGVLPDRVVLYLRPIEREAARTGLPVVDIIRDTLVHEVGHHIGLGEEDLVRLERKR